ncbi:MAG: hypothetical protein BRC58_05530 [Cyanobacteria bacterium QS_8_64_29]|nr:MAG: hypothetical protein BRC58_05530 [Cyanobacteria bacterium QS_8_64_29]
MHLLMLVVALGGALLLRWQRPSQAGSLRQRWQRSLVALGLPPLLLLATAGAIAGMGPQGRMLGVQVGWLSYGLAWGTLGVAALSWGVQTYRGWRTWQQARAHPVVELEGSPARLVPERLPYSARIGFWQPELVVTRGLLEALDGAHLQAVLAHERAHYECRDPFWFFWLGWLRAWTAWLPGTRALWQELLLLRELRADARAARECDPLLLAESLVAMARHAARTPLDGQPALHGSGEPHHLQARVEALLSPQPLEAQQRDTGGAWPWMLLALLPLGTVPLHG